MKKTFTLLDVVIIIIIIGIFGYTLFKSIVFNKPKNSLKMESYLNKE